MAAVTRAQARHQNDLRTRAPAPSAPPGPARGGRAPARDRTLGDRSNAGSFAAVSASTSAAGGEPIGDVARDGDDALAAQERVRPAAAHWCLVHGGDEAGARPQCRLDTARRRAWCARVDQVDAVLLDRLRQPTGIAPLPKTGFCPSRGIDKCVAPTAASSRASGPPADATRERQPLARRWRAMSRVLHAGSLGSRSGSSCSTAGGGAGRGRRRSHRRSASRPELRACVAAADDQPWNHGTHSAAAYRIAGKLVKLTQ